MKMYISGPCTEYTQLMVMSSITMGMKSTVMNFTNEEIILENEIKRKDTLKIRYIEPPTPEPVEVVNLLGSNMIVLTNQEEDWDC